MSIFSAIVDKIAQAAGTVESVLEHAMAGDATPEAAAAPAVTPASGNMPIDNDTIRNVDVNAVLTQLAARQGGGGDWQRSIVDLLKLLGLDSSLTARKQLAEEMAVHAGADGTAERNIALHKAVMQKLAENGGQVPASLRG